MVSYQFAPDQQNLRDSVAQFACDVITPVAGGCYECGDFPYDIVAKIGKLSLSGCLSPRNTAA